MYTIRAVNVAYVAGGSVPKGSFDLFFVAVMKLIVLKKNLNASRPSELVVSIQVRCTVCCTS